MRKRLYILILMAVALASCGVQKAPVLVTGEWQSVRTSAVVEGTWQGKTLSSPIQMTAYRDSLVIISVRPMLGIEVARIDADPNGWSMLMRVDGSVKKGSYAQVSQLLGERVTWKRIEELASGYNAFKKLNIKYKKVVKSGARDNDGR